MKWYERMELRRSLSLVICFVSRSTISNSDLAVTRTNSLHHNIAKWSTDRHTVGTVVVCKVNKDNELNFGLTMTQIDERS